MPRRTARTTAALAALVLVVGEAGGALAATSGADVPPAPADATTIDQSMGEPDQAGPDATPPRQRTATPLGADRRSGEPPYGPLDAAQPVDLTSPTICRTQGRVRVAATAGIVVTGFARCESGVWRMRVLGGLGQAGGMNLAPSNFSGVITSHRGVPGGQVKVDLRRHPRPVPAWSIRSSLTLIPQGDEWQAPIAVEQSRGSSSLRLTGELSPTGSYALIARGAVSFAGTSIPLSGVYRSATALRSHSWLITGTGRAGSLDGVVVANPRIVMTDRTPGLTGTTTLRLAQPLAMSVPSRLAIIDSANWQASAAGSDVPAWRPPGTSNVVATTARLGGKVAISRGKQTWSLTAPMAMRDRTLRIAGVLTIEGPERWRLAATGGSGTILGNPDPVSITGGQGSAVFDRGRASGSIAIVAAGEVLFDLPESWRTRTNYRLIPKQSSGNTVEWAHRAVHIMSAGQSRIELAGRIPKDGGFRLDGGGQISISGTPVPFSGFYESAGYGDSSRTSPRWQMGGRIRQFVALDGGAVLSSGMLSFTPARSTVPQVRDTSDLVSIEITGPTTLKLSISDDFELNCTYVYTDPDDWTLTAAGNYSDAWTPYTGFSVPDVGFSGTVTSVGGVETWQLTTSPVTWTGMVAGATMTSTFSIGNECPLDEHCPDIADAIYAGSSGAAVDFTSIPDVTAAGAFTTDGTWMRWDASSDPVTFNGITIEEPTLTAFTGTRDDEDPNLQMPDLSGSGGDNGIQVQLCGNFTVPVPDIKTFHSGGCVAWTETGVVMGQLKTGGDITTGSYNGISINGAGLSGFAWTDLPSVPTIDLNGFAMPLNAGRQYLTANVNIPGNVMRDFGTGTNSDTPIPAQGWFDFSGSFELDAIIPVGLKSATVSIDSIDAHIGKVGKTYELSFDAQGDIKINGRYYPIDAYIGLELATDASITVRVSVKGTYSAISAGTFDVSSLLTEGDFEPPAASLLDGSFDGAQNPNAVTDGGFENAADQGNLIANSSFEDGVGANLLVDDSGSDLGSFETAGNMLDNADFESRELLLNGDFEGVNGTLGGWSNAPVQMWPTTTGTIQPTLVEGSADVSIDPPNPEAGDYIMQVKNSGGAVPAGTGSLQGVTQIAWQPLTNGAVYTLTAWAKGSGNFQMALLPLDCSNPAPVATTAQLDSGKWTYLKLSVTGTSASCSGLRVYLTPLSAGGSALLDNVSLTLASSPSRIAYLTNAYVPHTVSSFDNMTGITTLSGAPYVQTDYNGGSWLHTTGCTNWLYAPTGVVNGDFDMKVRLLFGGGSSSDRDIANVGFWLNDAGGGQVSGYVFRLETMYAGGWISTNKNWMTFLGGTQPPIAQRNVWYEVHLTGQGNLVTAVVTDLRDNSTFYQGTIFLNDQMPYKGYFGQAADGACSGDGQRWDDLTIYSMASPTQRPASVVWDPAVAQDDSAYVSLTGTAGKPWNAQYMTRIEPQQGTTYAYTAWVRASSGTVSGNVVIETESQSSGTSNNNVAHEEVAVPFTATASGWARVSVTISPQFAGHKDLKVGFRGVNTASGQSLYVDGQSLQQLPWRSVLNSPKTYAWVTFDDTGNGVMNLADTVSAPSALTYTFPKPSAMNSTYTITADVRSDAPNSGASVVWNDGPSPQALDFMTTTSWKTITLKVTGRGNVPMLGFYVSNGAMQIDNVRVTASDISSNVPSALGAPPAPAGWTPSSGNAAPWVSLGGAAHTGGAVMTAQPGAQTAYAATAKSTVTSGSVYTATFWVLAGSGSSGVSGQVTLETTGGSTTDASTPVAFTATTGWTKVAVNLSIKSSGAKGFTLKITNQSGGALLFVDDVSLGLQGLALADPWYAIAVSGTTLVQGVLSDKNQAHAGSNFLQMQAVGSGDAGLTLSTPYAPKAGTQQTLAAWVRSPSGKPLNGYLKLEVAGGTSLSRVVPFYLADSSWHYVYATLPMMYTNGNTLLSTIVSQSPGVALQVDDVSSRMVETWYPYQNGATNMSVVTAPGQAASGSSYLTMATTSGALGGFLPLPQSGVQTSIKAGEVFTYSAYVRSSTGGPVNASLQLAYDGVGSPAFPFTATGEWQLVTFDDVAPRNASSIAPAVVMPGFAQLDVDSVTVVREKIVQDEPWAVETIVNNTGTPQLDWGVIQDESRARDGSLGLLEMTRSGSGTAGLYKLVNTPAPAAGQVYTMSAWVRSPSGTAITGYIKLDAWNSSVADLQTTSFTANSTWTLVTVRLPITKSGLTTMGAHIYVQDNQGATLDVDDVSVQINDWQVASTSGSTAVQTIINDGESAQQGTGFLQLTNSGSGTAAAYYDTQGSYAAGTQQFMTAWVRSGTGAQVNVTAEFGATAGGTQATSAVLDIGSTWTKVSIPFTPTASMSTLRMLFRANTPGARLDIDSVNITDQTGSLDGVDAPLAHPERGYAYLWDDAFGIKGAHLWAITGQIKLTGISPSIGVGATMYFDPSKSPIMTGTSWIKGDMALQVAYPVMNSCFSFGFDAGNSGSYVSIAGGALKATEFEINVAPKGCEIGDYIVPRGASFSFDAGLGEGTVHLDLAVGVDEDDVPYARGDVGVTDLIIGGVTYKTMELSVDVTPSSQDVSFVGDVLFPMGTFYGDFGLTATPAALNIGGKVSLKDWTLVGGGFSVQDFEFDMAMSVNFGEPCGSMTTAATQGYLTMGTRTSLKFDGQFKSNCGQLDVLMFEYDYGHRGFEQKFRIDYDSGTHLLSGGAFFKFERSTSWKFLGHRYRRHPLFAIGLAYSMDVRQPSTASLTLGGSVSVSGGSGTVVCSFGSSSGNAWQSDQDDECILDVYINVLGKHHYHGEW